MASVMNTPLQPLTRTAAPATSFVIVYDDRQAGGRAKRFSERLARATGAEAAPAISLWRSEMLGVPELAAEAARDAATSHFLLLALRGDHHLAPATAGWIESWSRQASGGSAGLIALFDPENSKACVTGSVRSYLRSVTNAHAVDFFCHCPTAPDPTEAEEPEADEAEIEPTRGWRQRTAVCAA